jgi:hypothetical protein
MNVEGASRLHSGHWFTTSPKGKYAIEGHYSFVLDRRVTQKTVLM